MTPAVLRAGAKINLGLAIRGRRPDGFHEIESILQTITLSDTVTLEVAEGEIRLQVSPPGAAPADATNLAWRAAAMLPAPPGRPAGLRIRLDKRIPAGAGLGGGSSDAAAVLLGLSRMRGGEARPEELLALAAGLGSDVPFFLWGGTALLRGRGTEVEPLPDALGYHLLVVDPGVPIPTRDVYAQVQEPLTPASRIASMTRFRPAPEGTVEEWVRLGNDLEPYARKICPAIGEITDRLLRGGATAAAMSGSGSSVFGIYRDPGRRDLAAREVERVGWVAHRCEPVGRREHRSGLGCS